MPEIEDSAAPAPPPEVAQAPTSPAAQPKWYRWRKDGVALIRYLLDSEVHTFAFSVAARQPFVEQS